MDNQEIFNLLSQLECTLFYRKDIPGDVCITDIEHLHKLADYMLLKWADLTGCRNQ